MLRQNTWSDLVHLANQLIHLVIREMFLAAVSTFLMEKEAFLPRQILSEPYNEDRSCGEQHVRNREQLDQP